MKYNLQFFAEEDVLEEVVEPQTEEVEYEEPEEEPTEEVTEEPEEEPEEKPVQTPEENAKYAAARRDAEAETRRVKAELDQLNDMVRSMYGDCENPETHEKVSDVKSYFEAIRAHKEAQARREMEDKGIDPNYINALVENNPAILQAKEVLARQQQAEFNSHVQSEIEQIHALDSSINAAEDLLNMENFSEFKEYVDRGYNFLDAFKLSNFEKLQNKSFDAAKQAAINQAKSKSHLAPISSVSDDANGEMVDIPRDELPKWKEYFPELSPKELKAKYNHSLHL